MYYKVPSNLDGMKSPVKEHYLVSGEIYTKNELIRLRINWNLLTPMEISKSNVYTIFGVRHVFKNV